MKSLLELRKVIPALLAIGVLASCSSEPAAEVNAASAELGVPGYGCTLTQGYWKTHPKKWPTTILQLGSQAYTQSEILALYAREPSGDASLKLAHQLSATLLNGLAGASAPERVQEAIAASQTWLAAVAGKLPYRLHPATVSGQKAVALALVLDQYNNGREGTPHCDSAGTTTLRPPVKLTINVPACTAGLPLLSSVDVTILDSSGRVTSSALPVSVRLGVSPSDALLAGGTSMTSMNGVARFTSLVLDKPGEYSLIASTPGLPQVETAKFSCAASDLLGLTFVLNPPAEIFKGSSVTVAVGVVDAATGAILTSYVGSVNLTLWGCAWRYGFKALGSEPVRGGEAVGDFGKRPGLRWLCYRLSYLGPSQAIAEAGVATFTGITVDKTWYDSYHFQATATDVEEIADSSQFRTLDRLHHLEFVTKPPATLKVGEEFSLTLRVVDDATGETVKSHGTAISLWPYLGCDARLNPSEAPQFPVDGVTTFGGLTVSGPCDSMFIQALTTDIVGKYASSDTFSAVED